MGHIPLYNQVPRIRHVNYHRKRDRFLSAEDVHEQWLMFIVEDGSFFYHIGDQQGVAAFGDIVLCPPGERFRRVVVNPVSLFVAFVDWEDEAGEVIHPYAAGRIAAGKVSIADGERLKQNFRSLQWAGKKDYRLGSSQIHHYLRDIWLLYVRETEERMEADEYPVGHDPLVLEGSRMIREHAYGPLNLNQIALDLQVSPAQLSKKFKKQLHMTPMQYLTSLRLDKAKMLLLETSLSLEDIAECCGYQSGFYLGRLFRKYEQMTPGEYRRLHRI